MNKIQQPLVSISCITYNHAPYIKEALEGFVTQRTDFPFEVLIHDDCSTDGTTDIIRKYATEYPDIIKPMYEEINQYSQGKPIGTVVWNYPRASGKYIAFCEGDDYWTDPLKLQKQVDFLETNPEYGLIYGKVKELDQTDGIFKGSFGGNSESFEKLIVANTIPTPTVLIRKDIIDSYISQGLNNAKYLMSDYPMWLFAAATSKIKFIDMELAVYRILNGSASHPKSVDKWIRFQESYRNIKLDYHKLYCPLNEPLAAAIESEFMKGVLRQRTLFNPQLKQHADNAIKNLRCGKTKKLFFHLINNCLIANFFLKLHLLNNNRRNH